jgi:predicted NBD/HSP70 family sugar kinase
VKSPIVPQNITGVLGSNRDVVRQHNLSILLQMIHFYGTVTRSQMAAATGLNRSTISDLVAELEQLGFATETVAASASGVGRPSYVVTASTKVVAFAVHPEVDATTVGVVTLSGKVLKTLRVPMSESPTSAVSVQTAAAAIAELKRGLDADQKIAGIGVAIPGQVRVSDNVVRLAPQLGWVEQPFGSMLSQVSGLPVFVDNDASIGCMAERNFGAARGYLDVVYLYAGSGGIGGGAIVNGSQLRGASGYGGELGHVRIGGSNEKDYSGLAGTLESMVRRDDLLHVFKMFSATDEELDVEIQSTKSGEAKKILGAQIDALGAGISSYVNIFNPEVIVLAGFLTSLFNYDPDRLLAAVKQGSLNASSERVVIRAGELGADLLMIGSAELAFKPLLENPSAAALSAVKKSR